MNIYDSTIRYITCDKVIGEVDFDGEIIHPKCGQCSNLTPDTRDKISYLIYH